MQNSENLNVKQMFSTRLKSLREEKGLSQDALAEKIGISRGSISFYEKAERTPDIEIFNRIADFFNVSLNYLIGKANAGRPENEEISEETGLSDKAITFLREVKKGKQLYVSEFINALLECWGIKGLAYSFSELKNILKDPDELFKNPVFIAGYNEEQILKNVQYIQKEEKRIEDESGRMVKILHGYSLFLNYRNNVERGFNKMILEMTGHTDKELEKIRFEHINNINSLGKWLEGNENW